MKIVWHGKEVTRQIHDTLENRMNAIGMLGKTDIKTMLNVGGGTRESGGKGRQLNRSKPGEPPHLDTGELRRSIDYELKRGAVPILRVGTNTKYAKWLELGTQGPHVITAKAGKTLSWIDPATGKRAFAKQVVIPKLEARPFLRPWLDKSRPDVKRILGRRLRGTGAGTK